MSSRPLSRLFILPIVATVTVATAQGPASTGGHRPPAVPLITHDPYFSVWSTTNNLNEGVTRHWTGAEHPLTSLIQVDGQTYRIMGASGSGISALPQQNLEVTPTRSIYTFGNDSVEVRVTFTSPLIPSDVDLLSRPVSFVTWDVRAKDGKKHRVRIYLEASGLLAVNRKDQAVQGSTTRFGNLNGAKLGSIAQPVLAKSGDDLRIDWGHLYLAAPGAKASFAATPQSLTAFATGVDAPEGSPDASSSAVTLTLPSIEVGTSWTSQHALVAYDDEFSIQYFGRNLKPYWRRNGWDASALLRASEREYRRIQARCEAFDRELVADLTQLGGADYAYVGALAHRQAIAAQKVVVDSKGQPLMFSKENFSNGCIGTVDVLYPAAPQLLLMSPTLTKASLAPILEYAASPRWKFPFAPHDLGTYPLANGQVYGGGERTEDNQMPVEESGNMLILLAALTKSEGNANFARKYWPQINRWAQYLAEKGFDPESQLSTDDFAGHLAHNVNLSAKAIVALGAFSYVAKELGHDYEAESASTLAKSFAARWQTEARDGNHYRLAFDKPGTWSQKYNLVWDRLLGLNLFPASVFRTELDYYRKVSNPFGLPLDNRRDYTKLDWIVWTATLTGERTDFDALIAPVVKFLDETPDRVPMTDWFRTLTPRKEGFQARSVVGGVFIKLLEDPATWRKYALRDRMKVGGWAAIPKPPVITFVVPTAEVEPVEWSYSLQKPSNGWEVPNFDSSGWQRGMSGFGTRNTPGGEIRTVWETEDIWMRREFTLSGTIPKDLMLYLHHDEDAEVYINGVLAGRFSGYSTFYQAKGLSEAARATLKPGRNVIAIHCHQTGGGQYIDAGFVTVKAAER